MKNLKQKSAAIIIWIVSLCLFFSSLCAEEQSATQTAFPHKLIFSDTPEIGRKWRVGIRNNDIVVWDLNWNINDWFMVDILSAGVYRLKVEDARIKDMFFLLTIKSRPISANFWGGVYKIGAGLKGYEADTDIESTGTADQEDFWPIDNSGMIFLTQGFSRNKHYLNLFSSLSFREKNLSSGATKTQQTYCITPGYRYRLGKYWSVSVENYMTNAEKLPIKVLQYGMDEDGVEFWNPNQELYSFMFWGFQYTRTHLRIDLNFISHYTFQGPMFPMIGIGWHF
jgi:hypothetical protein